jgi:hypothetical protein
LGSTPAAIWAGRQWRRPKTRKSILPPRAFGNRIGLTEAGRRSSASTAFACRGTPRVLDLGPGGRQRRRQLRPRELRRGHLPEAQNPADLADAMWDLYLKRDSFDQVFEA